MKRTFESALLLAALAFCGAASAATVTESEARAAVSAFVVSDPVGSAVLRGRTVSTVYERDGLWIAALSPSGHIILSGSDLADPIVGFSTNDFAVIKSFGYSFQMEMNYRMWQAGLHLAEIPITFSERRAGASKITGSIAVESLKMVFKLKFGG